jgi:hypothetical protein
LLLSLPLLLSLLLLLLSSPTPNAGHLDRRRSRSGEIPVLAFAAVVAFAVVFAFAVVVAVAFALLTHPKCRSSRPERSVAERSLYWPLPLLLLVLRL